MGFVFGYPGWDVVGLIGGLVITLGVVGKGNRSSGVGYEYGGTVLGGNVGGTRGVLVVTVGLDGNVDKYGGIVTSCGLFVVVVVLFK